MLQYKFYDISLDWEVHVHITQQYTSEKRFILWQYSIYSTQVTIENKFSKDQKI